MFPRLLALILMTTTSLAVLAPTPVLAQTDHANDDLIQRDANVPELPFADNPDPTLCGIPEPWNSDAPAWLDGHYQGELLQPIVFLYDSHLRRKITGGAATGTKVRILLFQNNPSLNYYFVKTLGENPQEGWVPEPFLKLEPSQ